MDPNARPGPRASDIESRLPGNLSNEELGVLNNAISSLQFAFVEAKEKGAPAAAAAPAEPPPADDSQPPPSVEETESKKKFTKSYGP